jgi:hypothetical protein
MWDKQTKRSASEPWIVKDRRGVTVVGDLVRETEKFLTAWHLADKACGRVWLGASACARTEMREASSVREFVW